MVCVVAIARDFVARAEIIGGHRPLPAGLDDSSKLIGARKALLVSITSGKSSRPEDRARSACSPWGIKSDDDRSRLMAGEKCFLRAQLKNYFVQLVLDLQCAP
jgi:hypothetical protein